MYLQGYHWLDVSEEDEKRTDICREGMKNPKFI